MINIRPFKSSDTDQIAQLFHDTIRSVNFGDYSEEQVKAWAPNDIHFRNWKDRCLTRYTLVAESDGMIAGFAELNDNGHIDCFYCHKNFQRKGVGTLLFDSIEKEALKRNHSKIFVEASITAKPFFQKMGFSLIKEQTVITRGVELTNFQMEKRL